jgi:dTDP-4-dehydrorhamnose reductase
MAKKDLKVLITGCGGMLGEAFYKAASQEYSHVLATDIDLNEPWLSYLDVRDNTAVEKTFRKFKPDIVFHLAALTDLEYCERHPKAAWTTNTLGTINVANAAENNSVLMIYISTAGIFDGKKLLYTDNDSPNPISQYGKSKYFGEIYVQNSLSKYFVFRAGWMMGGGPKKDKKFINKIYKQIKNGANKLFVVGDKLGTPTYTVDFSNAILKVIKTKHYGVYNQVCGGATDRYAVACEFVKLLGLSRKVQVKKTSSDRFKKDYFAPRPCSERLINSKLNKLGINYMRHWKDALKEYSTEFKDHYYAKV